MGINKHGIPVEHLARDFNANLAGFTRKVHETMAQLSHVDASMPLQLRHRELCTAVWATIEASIAASALSPKERDVILPLAQELMAPFWQAGCGSEPRMSAWLTENSRRYLEGCNHKSHVVNATFIASQLLDSIGTAESFRPRMLRQLVPVLAHRMIANVEYISDIKIRLGIQLPMLVAFFVAVDVALTYGHALRIVQLP